MESSASPSEAFPRTAPEQDLKEAFQAFGEVSSCNIIKDKFTGESRGFGFVEMPNKEEADKAIAAMNGKDMKGRNRISFGTHDYGANASVGQGKRNSAIVPLDEPAMSFVTPRAFQMKGSPIIPMPLISTNRLAVTVPLAASI